MKNLRVRLLHFSAGINCLGSRMTIAADATPGVPTAESIERVKDGYLVRFNKKLVFVPDTSVLAAEVEDLDAMPEAQTATPVPVVGEMVRTRPPLTESEIAARSALEERKRLAEERSRAKTEPKDAIGTVVRQEKK